MIIETCLSCHIEKRIKARGLCSRCYMTARKNQTIDRIAAPADIDWRKRPRTRDMVFAGALPRVRLHLRPEDILGQRGSAH